MWDVETIAERKSKYLNKLELHDIFAGLKAYDFELKTRSCEESTSNNPIKALVVSVVDSVSEKTDEQ